ALADAEIKPAVRQQIERRGFLGDQHRVVPGQHDDRGAEADPLGTRRQIAQQVQRGRDLAKAGEMMLDQKDARKDEPLGLDHVIGEMMVSVAVAGRTATRPGAAKESEFHYPAPLSPALKLRRNVGPGPRRVETSAGPYP